MVFDAWGLAAVGWYCFMMGLILGRLSLAQSNYKTNRKEAGDV